MQVMSEIVASCRSHDFTDVIFVQEVRGIPTRIIISHLPFGPTAYFHLHDVVSYCVLLAGFLLFIMNLSLLNYRIESVHVGHKT